ncbi:MAG: nucleoside triphosphate pyrophosphohydrolase [Bacteroidota bacterium]
MNTRLLESFQKLYDVVHELREKCPWDREQTKESLRHLTIEETYELSEAILDDNWDEIKVELGDVLLHILFYARIARELEEFDTADMMDQLREKLIRRHPHIYGDLQLEGSDAVVRNWEQIKMKEKKDKKYTILGGVPKGLPALIKAYRMQEKVSSVGFDWDTRDQVWDKVEEEVGEFRDEVVKLEAGTGDKAAMEQEFGDLLFALINYARFLDINPEDALEKTNLKFKNRFDFLEAEVKAQEGDLKAMSLAEMDAIWDQAKKIYK